MPENDSQSTTPGPPPGDQPPPAYQEPQATPVMPSPTYQATVALQATYEPGLGNLTKLPDELSGFNWGAFFFGWIWGIFNNGWLTFLGFIIPFWFIVCGFKGNEWAWRGKKWDSPDHFRRVQRTWAIWGVVFLAVWVALGFLFIVLIAAAGSGSSY